MTAAFTNLFVLNASLSLFGNSSECVQISLEETLLLHADSTHISYRFSSENRRNTKKTNAH